jgi:hypothetical protein
MNGAREALRGLEKKKELVFGRYKDCCMGLGYTDTSVYMPSLLMYLKLDFGNGLPEPFALSLGDL